MLKSGRNSHSNIPIVDQTSLDRLVQTDSALAQELKSVASLQN